MNLPLKQNNVNKETGSKLSFFMKMDIRAYAMIFALVAIWLFFAILTDGAFLSERNLSNLFRQMSVTAILAIGVVLVIVSGQIDLSVGSVAGLTGGVAAVLNVWVGLDPFLSIAVAIGLGILIGIWQGFWVAYMSVPSFIVTLGGMLIFRGILLGITKGNTIAPLSEGFRTIGQSYLSVSLGWILAAMAIVAVILFTLNKRRSRIKYGFEVAPYSIELLKVAGISMLIILFVGTMNAYAGIPMPIMLVLVLGLIFTFIAKNTSFGRQIYAIGGNPEAARLSGINIRRRVMAVFILSGFMASVAGVVLTARLNAATSSAGQMLELDAIAAAVIGGTSLMGGTGTIIGAVIGALIMASLDNGMSMMNVEAFWQYIVKGLILILAVWVDVTTKKRRG
ncbi:D-xylose transport system permease protein [Caldalkalibacillus uzonensis]|uniref:Xylose transport system permease protein XylH n=1 Tax=Caldalkalibacillus uzonensis TaxID=353224 RepID=A0ABU0CRV3_9BACI|nr:sugar ABC transporter permease [Caldalkalibacillus uzonensis]MDQ0338596.1 D-xylose transport system permease protein [Caldalkalibacillus uzonensis]